MNDYLPHRDSQLRQWTKGFARKVTADPERFGLTAAQAAEYDAAQRAFAAALTVATRPDTRTAPAVQAKNDARKVLIALSRQLAGLVQAYPGTTNPMRTQLGLTIRKKRVHAVTTPAESPRLQIAPTIEGRLRLHIGNRKGEGRARPTGVKGYTWFFWVGDTYPESLAGWRFGGNGIESNIDVVLPGVEPGAKVWFTANWFNNRIQPGPASLPIMARVAGGFTSAKSGSTTPVNIANHSPSSLGIAA